MLRSLSYKFVTIELLETQPFADIICQKFVQNILAVFGNAHAGQFYFQLAFYYVLDILLHFLKFQDVIGSFKEDFSKDHFI